LADQNERLRETTLLERALRQRDRTALSLLHVRYYMRIKRYIASRINSSTDAEDLAQNVFVELCSSDGKHPTDFHSAEAYLFGIARNLVRQHHRATAKSPKDLDTPAIEAIAADHRHRMHLPATPSAELDDTQDLILKALKHLAPAARQALKLALIDQLPPDQAARKASCSLNAFYQRLHVVRKTLRQLLAEQRQPRT
jgi:RNA polymerase sigma-70 factor (ECF subfamily)